MEEAHDVWSSPDDLTLWNLHQALAGSGIRKSVWYQLVRAGVAPQPVKVTAKRVAWVKAEVLAFRKHLIDQRTGRVITKHVPTSRESAGAERSKERSHAA